MNSRQMIKLITDDGWYEVAVRGSHHHYKHPTKQGKLTIPQPKSVLPIGTVNQILKQAGLK